MWVAGGDEVRTVIMGGPVPPEEEFGHLYGQPKPIAGVLNFNTSVVATEWGASVPLSCNWNKAGVISPIRSQVHAWSSWVAGMEQRGRADPSPPTHYPAGTVSVLLGHGCGRQHRGSVEHRRRGKSASVGAGCVGEGGQGRGEEGTEGRLPTLPFLPRAD